MTNMTVRYELEYILHNNMASDEDCLLHRLNAEKRITQDRLIHRLIDVKRAFVLLDRMSHSLILSSHLHE